MGRTRRSFVKLFISLIMTVFMLSSVMVAFAAGGDMINKIQVGNKKTDGKISSVKSVTLYTNGKKEADLNACLEGCTMASKSVTLDVMTTLKSGKEGGFLTVTSSDPSVAQVKYDMVNKKIKITAGIKNGKTNIILKDSNNPKKTAKVAVTTKTLVESFEFGDNVNNNQVNIAASGKLPLNLVLNPNVTEASNKKVTYSVEGQQEWKEEGYSELSEKDAKKKPVVKVNAKGEVTGVREGKAVIRITATDQKIEKTVNNKTKKVTTGNTTTVAVVIKKQCAKSINVIYPQKAENGKYNKIELKTNVNSVNHTFKIVADICDEDGKRIPNGVIFTSNKPKIATVDKNGTITAVNNGEATITIAPAEGTKNKNTIVTLKVKVTTDMEKINIPNKDLVVMVGKTVKTGATVDKSVTNKGLVYEVLTGNECITVNNSGVVKGIAAGKATFAVKSAANPEVKSIVNVLVTETVKTFSIKAFDIQGRELTSKSATLYVNRKYGVGDESYDRMNIVPVINGEVGSGNIPLSFTSSNPKVANVYSPGIIYANSPGTATITVKTADGSNKKASLTITVKAKVSEIYLNGADETKEELYVVNGASYTLKATTNSDATNKGVKFEKGNDTDVSKRIVSGSAVTATRPAISVRPGGTTATGSGITTSGSAIIEAAKDAKLEIKGSTLKVTKEGNANGEFVGTLKISAQDGTDYPRQSAYYKVYRVYVVEKEKYIKESDLESIAILDGSSYKKRSISVGLYSYLQIPKDVTNRELKWTSSNPTVASVDSDGILSFNDVGLATITVKAVKTGAEKSINIRVTESDMDMYSALNGKLKEVFQSEDYGWIGMKASVSSSDYRRINVKFDDMDKEINYNDQMKDDIDRMFLAFADAIGDASMKTLTISDYGDYYRVYKVTRDGMKFTVTLREDYDEEEMVVGTYSTVSATTRKLAEMMAESRSFVSDWLYSDINIRIEKTDKLDGYKPVDYYPSYYIVFQGSVNGTESMLDDWMDYSIGRLNQKISKMQIGDDRADSIISSFDYDRTTDYIMVNIEDGSKSQKTVAEALKKNFVDLMEYVYEDAGAQFEVKGLDEPVKSIYSSDYNTVYDDINALLSEKLGGDQTTLEDLGPLTVVMRGYYYGIEVKYYFIFQPTFNMILSDIDTEITDIVNSVNDNEGQPIKEAYNQGVLSVGVKAKAVGEDISFSKTRILEAINAILSNQKAEGVKIMTTGKDIYENKAAGLTEDELKGIILTEEDKTYGDLINKAVYVELDCGKEGKLFYTICFEKLDEETVNTNPDVENNDNEFDNSDVVETASEEMTDTNDQEAEEGNGETEETAEEIIDEAEGKTEEAEATE